MGGVSRDWEVREGGEGGGVNQTRVNQEIVHGDSEVFKSKGNIVQCSVGSIAWNVYSIYCTSVVLLIMDTFSDNTLVY